MARKGGILPYTVEDKYIALNDGRCCHTVPTNAWHSKRCPYRVKKVIEGAGLCGIHARSVKLWRGDE